MKREDDLKYIRKVMLIIVAVATVATCVGCTVQWAIGNKKTDCGFTHDDIRRDGKKDPQIFYGPGK